MTLWKDSYLISDSLNFLLVFRLDCVENLYSILGLDDLLVDVSESYDLDTCFNIL